MKISLRKLKLILETRLREFELNTKEVKIKKFQWDRKDYLQGRVYSWMYEKKKVTWVNPVEQHSDLESSDAESSDFSGDEGLSSRNLRRPFNKGETETRKI